MIRTSTTHPLQVDGFHFVNGHIGITLAPGKCAKSLTGPDWARDLNADIKVLKSLGTNAVITAVTKPELEQLQIANLGQAVLDAGMKWFHLPFTDVTAPTKEWFAMWEQVSPRLHAMLEAGQNLVFHCRGGLERAPTMVALLMMERGLSIEDALDRITKARSGVRPLRHQLDAIERYMPPASPQIKRIRACLRAGALGDAMGAELEFWDIGHITRMFPRGVDQLLPHRGLLGAITDDTQMSLFTAEAVIETNRRVSDSEDGIVKHFHHSLLRWMETQNEVVTFPIDRSGLVTDERLHSRRAPGMTCLSALRDFRRLGRPASNNSKGCGTIMRVAPIAFSNREDRRELAMKTSALTHGHPTGQEAAATFVDVLTHLIENGDLLSAINWAAARTRSGEVKEVIDKVLLLPRNGKPYVVETIGGGWVAEEALGIALYAGLCATSLDHGLQIALLHSGDSDSTGAIAGNLLGLMFEDEVMKHPLIEKVECSDLIERLARQLV